MSLRTNVERIRKARGLSEEELGTRIGMSRAELAKFLESPPKRKEGIVHKLSRELLVPEVLLFADKIPVKDTKIPDFRLSQPEPGGYSRDTLRWIDFAESIQATAKTLNEADSDQSLSALIDADDKIPDAAAELRGILNFSIQDQLAFESPRLMFAALRQKIETLNVFVLQLSFSDSDGTGFCISGDSHDVIVLNTRKQSPARRLFTLGHEIYHCVLEKTGLSDSGITNNTIEKRCNKFAAHFLAPNELVRAMAKSRISTDSLRIEELRKLANTLNISMYATLLRLVELGIYGEHAVGAWKKFIRSSGDPDVSKGGGGKRVDEWKYKLSRYGFKFASVFGEAKNQGKFDDLEFYRFSGIKPKYQSSYIQNASRGRPEDADVDEGEDNE